MNDISEAPKVFEVPTPKFHVGQTVYKAVVEIAHIDECPDCGNTKEWSITTGSGLTFKIACPRCKHGVLGDSKEFTGVAQPFVVGSVEIAYGEWGPTVEYKEAGKQYHGRTDESSFYPTADEALAVAQVKAAEHIATFAQRSEKQRLACEIARQPIAEALATVLQSELEEAKDRYHKAVDVIIEVVEQEWRFKATKEEVLEIAKYILDEMGEETPEEWEYS